MQRPHGSSPYTCLNRAEVSVVVVVAGGYRTLLRMNPVPVVAVVPVPAVVAY